MKNKNLAFFTGKLASWSKSQRKVNNVKGISSRSVITLRNAVNLAWWPAVLKYDLGDLPESMVKSSEPINRITEWAPMASHCSTAPAVFILSEPERIERRAEVREKLYNNFNMENVFFVLSNHRQGFSRKNLITFTVRTISDIIVKEGDNWGN